ncbi:uncharacterized protein KY384_007233 [Bacidia gigantensis]|uniref:uncharacterized protein n=1 Tax=Bacidia gigantensis TaxID=2732470 RepID=UPI001D04CCBC|nr:uncharacterized protein KY384_007233 [Bacidia gigantensis]KAG8528316.1 hypothetical protein KY384_007233 [Bacidia gigantensis]
MPVATHLPRRGGEDSLKAIPYIETTAAEPPIHGSQPAKPPNKTIKRLRKSRASQHFKRPQTARDDYRRDSDLDPSSSSFRDSRTTLSTDISSAPSIRQSSSFHNIRANSESRQLTSANGRPPTGLRKEHRSDPVPPVEKLFLGLNTEIPTGSFEDLTNPGQVEFSKRGSMLLGGKKAVPRRDGLGNGTAIGSRRNPLNAARPSASNIPSRVLSADEEELSNKVRSMYEGGGSIANQHLGIENLQANGSSEQVTQVSTGPAIRIIDSSGSTPNGNIYGSHGGDDISARIHSILRQSNELAGGIEDWEDINNGDVDRYGFIVPRKPSSQVSSMASGRRDSPDGVRMQRMSTLLQIASERPRRSRSRLSKTRSAKSPTRSTDSHSMLEEESAARRPKSSQSSYRSTSSKNSRFRTAANRLPHNKNRRCVDSAGDMLTLPPGLADIAEDSGSDRVSSQKVREWERDEKWRKMAKVVKKDPHGGGMEFEFDVRNPKLIERAWKGIPDKWRATAWHSFLSSSAKKRTDVASDNELKSAFQQLLHQSSPDDVQIDIDVPRTINSHIMFRRRYRGGQRLLFRVLHCMSIYFPVTGYVQGMAALAATLLCYFDEEMTFVMLVRLWQLRGLDQLYRSGFAGLMCALEEFETQWLRGGEVAMKLQEYDITSTSYGTRWYLTLFNYSIPFPAQLRIWDVFMLLGDPDVPYPSTSPPSKPNGNTNLNGSAFKANQVDGDEEGPRSFHGGLDVLHACSAALIDGTKEILMDSDFENAMKVLTSWIPVRDEELLMNVARVEWKMKRRKNSAISTTPLMGAK